MTKVQHFDADGNLTGTSVSTTPSRWDEDSRVYELAYTEYLDGLCECGVPRSVCMDPKRVWKVDFRVGNRCQALERVQKAKQKQDAELEKKNIDTFPLARKWTAEDVTAQYGEGIWTDDGEDSQS